MARSGLQVSRGPRLPTPGSVALPTAALVRLAGWALLVTSSGCDATVDFQSRSAGGAAGAGGGSGAGSDDPPGTLVVRQGGTYTGSWESLDPEVPAVTIETTEAVVIESCRIRSAGAGVWAMSGGARLTVRGCEFEGLEAGIVGAPKPQIIDAGNFVELVVERNRFASCGAVRALNYGGHEATGQLVTVRYNRFRDVDGRVRDASGAYVVDPLGGASAVVLDNLRSASVEIAWNEVINAPGASNMFYGVHVYESGGTAALPITIHDNFIRGGYASDPAAQVDYGGSMIDLGNAPSGGDVGYIDVARNQLISFEHAGISVDGGHHQQVFENRIISARALPDGRVLGGTWRRALTLWDEYGAEANGNFHDNVFRDNAVAVVDRDGASPPDYLPSLCDTCEVSGSTSPFGRQPTSDDEAAELVAWQEKLVLAGVVLP